MNIQEKDFEYMKICFELAKLGEGKVSPNPLVGAILVNEQDEIVAKGWHKGYGLDHAEVDCIKNYENEYKNRIDYSQLTLYVNLEPCNHQGKTPPCSDLIISKKIKRVVVAAFDPNPKHTGGIKKIKDAGIQVTQGVLEKEAIKLNEIFFKNVQKNKPFVALKTATTLDGKIATKTGSSKWITSDLARDYVQNLRNKYDAILTSSSTVIADNPSLTARKDGCISPIRIILDSRLKTNPNSKVYNNDGVKTYLFYCDEQNLENAPETYPKTTTLIKVSSNKNHINLTEVIEKLYALNVKSVLIEAGGILNAEFIKENLVDKIYHFIAPKTLGDNNAKSFIQNFDITNINECRKYEISTLKNLTPDILIEYYPID